MKIACCLHNTKVASEVREALSAEGFDFEEFLSEVSLLRTMKKRNFDLILVDEQSGSDQEVEHFSLFYSMGKVPTPVIAVSATDVSDGVTSMLSLRLQHQGQ